MQLSRREFLVAANAVAMLALIESCVPGASKIGSSPAPQGGNPYERALRLLRDAVRASPDHLSLRAADLVATRDANKIVEFVRDHIALVPSWWTTDDPRFARRWGDAATLRGGQGSLRDRAELLAGMLSHAGFKATVMTADRPASLQIPDLYRPHPTEFKPDVRLVDQAAAQLRQAGAPPPASPPVFDPGPDQVAAIAAALPASLQKAKLRDDLLPTKIPVVEFEQDGRKRYAIALGSLATVDSAPAGLATGQTPSDPPVVRVTVSAVSSPAPGSKTPRGRQIELVRASWPAETVVGKQVLLTFMPPGGAKAYLESSLAAQMIRVPVLRVQGADPSLVATGPLITVHGDVAAGSAQDGYINGPLGQVRVVSESERNNAIASVANLKVAANASAFADVALDVDLVDVAGQPVDGLDAGALSVKEEGKAVGAFSLVSNVRTQKRPRVMIAYDVSGSVIGSWSSPAARAAFEKKLASAIVDAASVTPFDTQVVLLGADPDPNRWTPPDALALASAMGAGGSASDTWETIAGAALDQGLSAIVYLGDSTDDVTSGAELAELQNRLAAARVPVVVIPTGPPAGATAQRIVELSGGLRLDRKDPATPSKIAALVQQRATQWVAGGYRLRYIAPADGPGERTVTVGLADRPAVAGSSKYTVPTQPLSPPSFAGLYVAIEVAGVHATRHLAGVQVNYRGAALGRIDDPAALAQTRAALDGITTIAIEPGTPTTAAILDDVLTSLISIEPLRAWWPVKDVAQLQAAVHAGVVRTPGLLASLLLPSARDGNAVPGLKVAILHERVLSDSVVERHADLAIGANPMLAVTTDAHAGFGAALINSVSACQREATAFDDTAYARLAGRTLVSLPFADGPSRIAFYKTLPPEKVAAWTQMADVYSDAHLLAPRAGEVDAFWVVDPDSGAAKAVFLDSTGGAITRLKCKFSPYAEMAITLSILAIICSAAESTGAGCLGINSAATAMTVAALFIPGEADAGTPFGAALGLINPFGGVKGFGGFGAGIGIALLIVTIQASCS